ncbi:MAG: sulfate ABC transporter permease subunit CysW [Cellvibrio sp.]|jgi:sulfate transport system permease protein
MHTYIPRKPDRTGKVLVGLGLFFVVTLLVLPLVLIFFSAFRSGWQLFTSNLMDSDMISAIKLTLLVAVLTVPVNLVFGTLIAWCVTKFQFFGKKLIIALIDTPYAISPVVAGLCYLLLYGNQGLIGGWLDDYGIQVIFAWPGIVLVTIFVTSPYVARELIPLMESQGNDEEEAAILLGASGWAMFRRITLPNIKWALLYGTVLTTARAVGEFGSVAVISGSIRGQTNTLPLHVQLLQQDYNSVGAFTAALLLASIALLTLILKTIFEYLQNKKHTTPA